MKSETPERLNTMIENFRPDMANPVFQEQTDLMIRILESRSDMTEALHKLRNLRSFRLNPHPRLLKHAV